MPHLCLEQTLLYVAVDVFILYGYPYLNKEENVADQLNILFENSFKAGQRLRWKYDDRSVL